MRFLLVANPSSGTSDEDMIERCAAALRVAGEVTTLSSSTRDTFGDDLRDAASGADAVVVAAGDGTINLVINELADRLGDYVMGVIPMGTGNDLARTLGMPLEPDAAASAIAVASERRIDLCRASGSNMQPLFVNACLGGFPVEVDQAIDEQSKRRLGPLAFWAGGAKVLAKMSHSAITMNGTRMEDCIAVGVGNGRTAGGGLPVWPDADPSDGKLDGCLLCAPDIAAALRLGVRVRNGSHALGDGVACCREEKITVESDPPIEINTDGEVVDLKTPVTFEVVGSLRVLA